MRDPQDSQFPLLGERRIGPFFLFSATAGQLADKYDKARIIRAVAIEHVPTTGPALHVSNHVSFVGAPLAPAAATPEALRESIRQLRGERR